MQENKVNMKMGSGWLFASTVLVCVHCRGAGIQTRCRKDCAALSAGELNPALCPGTSRCSCTADAAATPARGLSCWSVNQGFCTRFTARAELHATVVAALPPPVAELSVEMAMACSNMPLAKLCSVPLSMHSALLPLLRSASHPAVPPFCLLRLCVPASPFSFKAEHNPCQAPPSWHPGHERKGSPMPLFHVGKDTPNRLGDKAVPCQCHKCCLHNTVSQGLDRPTPTNRASPKECSPFQLKFVTRKCHPKLHGLRDATEIQRHKTHVQNKGVYD